MRKSFIISMLFVLAVITSAGSQTQKITLEEIWNNTFKTTGMNALRSMNNGTQYTILNYDSDSKTNTIDLYDYQTLEHVETIVSSNDLEGLSDFSSYTFSMDESKILLATTAERIYRHSTRAKYYSYDIKTKLAIPVADMKIQAPAFSPDGTKIAYVYENNIYVKDMEAGTTRQITSDGEKNKIINGVTDWVYEEEFAFVRAFQWNKTGTHIAFIRFYEVNVPEFSMDIYGNALYPSSHTFKYPKAGTTNATVSLHIYDIADEKVTAVNELDAYYIPRIKWTNDPDVLSIQKMNRHQNERTLLFYNTQTKTSKVVLDEKDQAYIDITDHLTFLNDNSFIWTSEKDGYNHLYHYDKNGKRMGQITKGNYDVTDFYGYDAKTKRVFYQSVENGTINRGVYAIKLNGKRKQPLSIDEGTNRAAFSKDFSYYINTFSSTTVPYTYTLHSGKNGKNLKEIVNNTAVLSLLDTYELSPKEFSTIKVNDYDLNMWMIKPAQFDPSKNYPLFMYQYSGPGSQQVANRWMNSNDYWHQLLAQQGYIIVCVDGRGTGYKGADFKKMTYKQLGKYEVEDQIAVARQLGRLPYIDENRIGIWGWSYGGFMASNCILQGSDVFKAAIAVAPVTNWRFYDTIYTERYMQTPEENPEGYDNNSPITHAKKLKGNYLIVHGSADDNVHVQNTMRMVDALIAANKQFEWAIYPDKNHGIYGGNTRLQLYTKMTRFIHENLGGKDGM